MPADSTAALSPTERELSADWARSKLRRLKDLRGTPEAKTHRANLVYGPRSYRPGSNAPTSADIQQQRANAYGVRPDSPAVNRPSESDAYSRVKEGIAGIQGRGVQADAVAQRAARFGQLRAMRQARDRGGMTQAQALTSATAEASAMARQGYARIWDMTQEALEDWALGFWGVASIILIWPVVGIFVGRWLVGNTMGGFGEFSFRGVRVPRVPPYTIVSGMYHAFKVLINILVFLIWAGAIVVIISIAMNIGGIFCDLVPWFVDFFTGGACSAFNAVTK